jgi:hypothetical protein
MFTGVTGFAPSLERELQRWPTPTPSTSSVSMGSWVMSIHRKHRSRDQRLKTKVSTRKLALHGALLGEGFLDYWR